MSSRFGFSGGNNHATIVAPIGFFFSGGRSLGKKHSHSLRASMSDFDRLQFEIFGEDPETLLHNFIEAAERKYQCSRRGRK